jgi:pyrrolidone-carboxylate peptidase
LKDGHESPIGGSQWIHALGDSQAQIANLLKDEPRFGAAQATRMCNNVRVRNNLRASDLTLLGAFNRRSTAAMTAAAISISLAACGGDTGTPGTTEEDIKLDTRTALARKQYDANVKFAKAYASRCEAGPGKRVIVTGYGRFQGNLDNATGRIVESLTGVPYPATLPVADGAIDPPDAQTSVKTTRLKLDGIGDVTICGMILPVYWDLAPILLAKEISAFKPDLVLMNGVASGSHNIPMRLELGSENTALPIEDGSGILHPFDSTGSGAAATVIETGPKLLPSRMSWAPVKSAMRAELTKQGANTQLGGEISEVFYGGFPSSWLTYLCNNIVYVTNYLMANPGKSARLLEPSVKLKSTDRGVTVTLSGDFSKTPRAFIHWPDVPRDKQKYAASVLRAAIVAQLSASARGELPTPGDPQTADQF